MRRVDVRMKDRARLYFAPFHCFRLMQLAKIANQTNPHQARMARNQSANTMCANVIEGACLCVCVQMCVCGYDV